MGEDTDRFNKCIENLHKTNPQGISSRTPNCRYDVIMEMVGKRIDQIDPHILRESNLEEYLTSRLWNRKTFIGALVEYGISLIREAEYISYKSQKL